MIGKIIGTSLAIQFFYMGFNWSFFIVCRICVFGANVGPTAKFLRMEQAQQNSGTANVYQGIMEFTNSEYTNKFYSLFHRWLLSLQLFYAAIGAAVDQTDSQQFLLPIIMPLVLSVYVGFF
jgi:ABC-2 type transport system permease protein